MAYAAGAHLRMTAGVVAEVVHLVEAAFWAVGLGAEAVVGLISHSMAAAGAVACWALAASP